MRILIVIDLPDLKRGVTNLQYYKLIKSLPVEVEVDAFPHGEYFIIEFASRIESDLNKAVRYFLGNFNLEVYSVFRLGNKEVVSI